MSWIKWSSCWRLDHDDQTIGIHKECRITTVVLAYFSLSHRYGTSRTLLLLLLLLLLFFAFFYLASPPFCSRSKRVWTVLSPYIFTMRFFLLSFFLISYRYTVLTLPLNLDGSTYFLCCHYYSCCVTVVFLLFYSAV